MNRVQYLYFYLFSFLLTNVSLSLKMLKLDINLTLHVSLEKQGSERSAKCHNLMLIFFIKT